MKVIGSIVLFFIGMFVLLFWLSGMHGHLKFRPHMLQDWLLAGIVLICFGTAVLLLFWLFYKRKQN